MQIEKENKDFNKQLEKQPTLFNQPSLERMYKIIKHVGDTVQNASNKEITKETNFTGKRNIKNDLINPSPILEKKDKKSLTTSIHKAIRLVSIDPDEVELFGSFAFKDLKFPTDIDLIEYYHGCCTVEEVSKKSAKEIQNLTKKVINEKGYYVSELKAGIDAIYDIDLGNYTKNVLTNWDAVEVNEQIKELLDKKLLTQQEYDDMHVLVKPDIKNLEYEKLHDMVREKYIIRWDEKDILAGYKMLEGNRKRTLSDSLHDKTPVKLDIWAPINNKYIEVTNFFILSSKNQYLNTTEKDLEKSSILKSLINEAVKFASGIHYKPYKMAKRLWSIALFIKDIDTLKLITPLLNSDASRLNQIIGDVSVIILMIDKIKYPPYEFLLNEMDNFKTPLSNVTDIKVDTNAIFSKIDLIVNNHKHIDKNKLFIILGYIKQTLQDAVNSYALDYMKKVNLYPIPQHFLNLD